MNDHIFVPDPEGKIKYTPNDGRPPFWATSFDPATARRWNGGLDEDNNYPGMWRTAEGRWVLEKRPMDCAKPDWHGFLTDQQAREWLERNEHAEAVEEFFGKD